LLAHAAPATAVAATPEFEADKWMRAIRSFIVISGAQLILSQQSDILVVGTVLSPRDAGLYSAASQLSWLTMLGAQAVIFVVLPVRSCNGTGLVGAVPVLDVRTAGGAVVTARGMIAECRHAMAGHEQAVSGRVGGAAVLLRAGA